MKLADLDIDWRVVIVAIVIATGWVIHAEIDHKKARSAEQLSRILGERVLADEAKEEGKKEGELELLRKLCDSGKLEGEDCAEFRE